SHHAAALAAAHDAFLPNGLRSRRDTVHYSIKFGLLLGLHALKTPNPGSETCSVALTNGLLARQIAPFSLTFKLRRATTSSRIKTVVLYFRCDGSAGRSRPVTWARTLLIIQAFFDHLSDARARKSRPRRVLI